MAAPRLEVVKDAVEETAVVGEKQAGVFTKFIVLVLLPTIYTIGLGMLLLHFAGVNIHTQVKSLENFTKPLVAKINAPSKTAPSKDDKEKTSETNNVEVPYSNSNGKEGTVSDSKNTDGQNEAASTNGNSPTSEEAQAKNTVASDQLYAHLKPEQIANILKGINNNEEVLKQFKKLDPKTASQVITLLDPAIAGWLVTQME